MSEQPDKPRRKRWRFRFSLRTLMIAVLLISVMLAPVVWKWHRYQKQKAVVDWIESSEVESIVTTNTAPGGSTFLAMTCSILSWRST